LPDDLDRLRQVYKNRKARGDKHGLYTSNYKPFEFAVTNRQKDLKTVLDITGSRPNPGASILEIGCGTGGVLLEYLTYGFTQEIVFGIDLLFDRLEEAHLRIPGAGISNADGRNLPFLDETFDFILQYTAFSSVLDPSVKKLMAKEMTRTLKRKGLIIWYDFWWNPINHQTQGINKNEIMNLFPGCSFCFQKITLAPPIARIIVPISWRLGNFFESLKFLNSHYLVAIQK